MKTLVRVVGVVVIIIVAFFLATATMSLFEKWSGRTPEEVGVLYGIGQVVLWIFYTALIMRFTSRRDQPPSAP